MPTYLYCLLSAGSESPAPGVTGHAGQPVRALEAGDLRAWVSDLSASELPERSAGAARIHDSVCTAALAGGVTPLPARFGQRFDSDASCVAELRRRERELLAALDLVAGCVEMTVHLRLPAAGGASSEGGSGVETAADQGPGRRHLERLRGGLDAERKVQRRAESAAERLRHAAGDALRAERIRVGEGREVVVAHLVVRDHLDDYREALETVRAAEKSDIRWSGPYVPYSFTG